MPVDVTPTKTRPSQRTSRLSTARYIASKLLTGATMPGPRGRRPAEFGHDDACPGDDRDLKLVLQGKQSEPFYLKPSDIIYVPEKFAWF